MKLCSVTRLCSKNTFQKSHQNPWIAFSCVLNPCQPILRGGTLWLRATPRDYGVSWQLIIFARFSFKIDLRTGLQGPQFLKTHLEREHFALDALGRHGKQSRAEQSSAPRQAGCVLCYQWSSCRGSRPLGWVMAVPLSKAAPADFQSTTSYLHLPSCASGREEVGPAVPPLAVDRRSSCVCCLLFPYRSSPSPSNFEFHCVSLLCFRYKSTTAGICCLLHYKASDIICKHCAQFCCSSVNNVHGCCAPSESET